MPLIEFWKSNPDAVSKLSVSQIVSTAGDGNLRDNSLCQSEIREYCRSISSQKISEYVEQCLSSKLDKGGSILQDLVNELGRRLDYAVKNGRYQGTSTDIGFDGLWKAPEGNDIIVEVKTSDAYRVSLDTIVNYRSKLRTNSEISENSTILIIVGRQDTGELEAQVRGSRHAWDIRLISVEALIKLVILKENSAEIETDLKIRSILLPVEYTRLDRLVDVMFTTATDVSPSRDSTNISEESFEENQSSDAFAEQKSKVGKVAGIWDFTEPHLLANHRSKMISALSRKLKVDFIKQSRALFWDKDHKTRIACTISKKHTRRSSVPYWYAHHPKWDEFLLEGDPGLLVLGCMDLDVAFAIPIVDFHSVMSKLNKSKSEEDVYWHIHVAINTNGKHEIVVPRESKNFNLEKYKFDLVPSS